MNLGRLRWSLTAWYVGVMLVILLLGSVVVYLTIAHVVRSEVDSSLRSGANNVARQVTEEFIEASQAAVGPGDSDAAADLDYLTGTGGESFFAIFSPTGEVLDNPLNLQPANLIDSQALQEAIAQGEAWRTTRLPQGSYRILYLPVQEGPRTIAVIGAGRSLAEQQRELQELLLVLLATGGGGIALALVGGTLLAGRALAPSRRAFEQQRAFIADASHELRSPLTLIRASAEALQRHRERLLADDAEAIDNILTETDGMTVLVSDLLTLARLDQGPTAEARRACDLASLLQDGERFARAAAGDRALNIVLDQADVALPVLIDQAQIARVLRILLDNAIQHTPDGGSISLRAALAADEVLASVSDTGPGLQPEELTAVFDRFYRSDRARPHTSGGTGLGLAIAKGIIDAHGGRIWVEDTPGQGATFCFTLPLRTEA